jgi:hypothetical protein
MALMAAPGMVSPAGILSPASFLSPAAIPSPSPSPAPSASEPTSASTSVPVKYRVTIAARVCDRYDQVMGARVRGDRQESLRPPGRDSVYQPGQVVAPEVEATAQPDCRALTGARFTFGGGRHHDGPLSEVTNPSGKAVATKRSTALLDQAGRRTGGSMTGAVTVTLSKAQAALADSRGRLWVQGGTAAATLPTADGAVLGFGTLRCALDHRDGANVAWLAFPAGVRHVFCFAYYVREAPPAGTVVVRAAVSRPVGYPEPLHFTSDLSKASGGGFDLAAATGSGSSTTFVRPATAAGGAPYTVTAQPPAGWTVPAVSCAATRAGGAPTSAATAAGASVTVALAAGETVTCTYTLTPPPPGRLTARVVSENGVGAFSVGVAGPAAGPVSPPGGFVLSAATTAERQPVTAGGVDLAGLPDGGYTVAVAPPADDAAAWDLASVTCDGTPAPVSGMTATVTLNPGAPRDCVFRLVRTPGGLRLRVVTAGDTGAATFAVTSDAATLSEAGGFGLVATTVEDSSPATASGDLPARLPLGNYEITAVPALSTVVGSWRLASLDCGAGPGSPPSGADGAPTVTITLNAAQPTRVCTASYAFLAATTVDLRWRSDDPTATTALEVRCTDGAMGRLVARGVATAALPRPLYVTAPIACDVAPVAGFSGEGVSITVQSVARTDPGAEGVPVTTDEAVPPALPVHLDIRAEAASYVVTAVRGRAPGATPPQPDEGSFSVPPMIFVGTGIILGGAFLLLLAIVRRRNLLD